MLLEIDDDLAFEVTSMAYNRWSMAYDNSKKVKALTWESAGKFCPKADFPLYQAEMIKAADKELALSTRLKDVLIVGSMGGLNW